MGQPPATHDDLREFETIDTRHMSGTPSAEREAVVARYWLEPDPDRRSGPAAETFREFHARVAWARTQFLPSLPDGTMVFGHGLWMALLFWQMWGFEKVDHLSMSLFRRFQLGFPTPNAAVYAITHMAPGQWVIKVDEAAMRAIARSTEHSAQPESNSTSTRMLSAMWKSTPHRLRDRARIEPLTSLSQSSRAW